MENLPSFLLFAFTAAITPGPNNIMIMASGLNFGLRASLPHLLGISLGVPAMLLMVGIGAGYLFERYPLLHEIIKIAGVLYLLYLAWLIARSAPSSSEQRSAPLTFFQAALFQWVNPKTWIMGTSAIAAYTSVGTDMALQVAIICLVFFLMALPSAGTWLVFGRALQRLLRRPHHRNVFNIVMAILLVASVVPVVDELIERHW